MNAAAQLPTFTTTFCSSTSADVFVSSAQRQELAIGQRVIVNGKVGEVSRLTPAAPPYWSLDGSGAWRVKVHF